MTINKTATPAIGADNGLSRNKTYTVTLSDSEGPLSTGRNVGSVTLSDSEGSLSTGRQILRGAQHDSAVTPSVTLSDSEGSPSTGRQILRGAQHDSAVTPSVTLSDSEGSPSTGHLSALHAISQTPS